MNHTHINGRRIEYLDIPAATSDTPPPPLVLLHEGLGCAAMWREFPQQLAAATGCRVVAASRAGYGQSTPYSEPRQADYMQTEASIELPALLAALGLQRPILIGHSDGASIALLHAAEFPEVVRGLVVMAPHEFVEEETLAGLRAARQAWASTDLPQRLARYHADAQRVFHDWNDTWLNPEFRHWNIEAALPRLRCPVTAIQGEDDEYATFRQIDVIAAAHPDTQLIKLPACGHSPHRDQAQRVIAAIQAMINRCN